MADAMGFESLFMHAWRVRERILKIIEATTGGRVIFNSCKIGGVRRDISADAAKEIIKEINDIEKDMRDVTRVFFGDRSVKSRLVGVGVLSKEEAWEMGCVGPMARGSGVDQDMRSLGYAAFKELDFQTMVRSEGDSYARCLVRCDELFESIRLIREGLQRLPEGEISVAFKGNPDGEVTVRTEQPRGEVIYYLKANGTKNLQRFRVRTPTFANIPAMLKMLPGSELADVPVLVLTIDPCISCTER
jgi:ech hydrogenase subunit E